MAKRRKRRRVNLGSTASQHREEYSRYLTMTQNAIQSLERRPGSCYSMLQGLFDIERHMSKAAAHRHSIGRPIKPHVPSRRSPQQLKSKAFEALDSRFEK